MNKAKLTDCLWAVKLLLCLFILSFFGCSGLKNMDTKALATPQRILQIVVKESDFEIFNQSIQELALVALDFRMAQKNISDNGDQEYYITFLFASQGSFVSGSSALMSTGLVRRIYYSYQE